VKQFNGHVAVITGGASGIGRGLAERFAREEMKIVIGDVEEAALDQVIAGLAQRGAFGDCFRRQALRQARPERLGPRLIDLRFARVR
jgi:NAD(P)-dependent dehydrogenase (short-subunit alcohol dehydrogenase family)